MNSNNNRSAQGWLARDANNLNALRLLAAIAVVVSHCVLLRAGMNHESAEPLASLNYFNLGDHALNVFFFISGLTVTASLARSQSITDFVVARALRIWPGLLAVVLVTVFFVGPMFSEAPLTVYFGDRAWSSMIAKTFVLSGPIGSLPGLFETNPLPHVVNGSPWTLRFEVLCYIGLLAGSLATAPFSERVRTLWMPATTLVAGLAMIVWPAGEAATTLDHLLRFWFAFGLGATVYQIRAVFDHSVTIAAALALGAGLAFVTAVDTPYEGPAAIIFIGAATLFAARLPIGGLRGFTNRFDLSYGVYITAWPITQVLIADDPTVPLQAMLTMILVISFGLAFVSWMLVEKPAMALRPRVVAFVDHIVAGFPSSQHDDRLEETATRRTRGLIGWYR